MIRIPAAVLVALAVSIAVEAHPGLHHDIEAASQAIARDPGKADLYVERAFLYRLSEDYRSALEDLDLARKLEPGNLRVAAERGMTLSALSRDAEAAAELSLFLAKGGTAATFAERAKVNDRLGRRKDAVADYSAAIALTPDIELYLARGTLQEGLGDLKGASAGYRDGLARVGDAVTLDLALLRVETALRRYDAALRIIDDQMAKAPVKTDWYLRRADVLAAAGRPAAAATARADALREADAAVLRNANGMHLYARAKALAALGKNDDARRDLEQALQKSPRFAEAQALLASLGTTDIDKGTKP